MSRTSPTARTLRECKRREWPAQVVEQTIPHTFIKRDLFGIIDVIAATPEGIIGIQATSGTNHAAHVAKALAEPRLAAWLKAGARFVIWSWSKRGPRGKAKRWTLREEEVRL